MYIRDKFGQSAMGKLVIAELAVPFPIVILVCASPANTVLITTTYCRLVVVFLRSELACNR